MVPNLNIFNNSDIPYDKRVLAITFWVETRLNFLKWFTFLSLWLECREISVPFVHNYQCLVCSEKPAVSNMACSSWCSSGASSRVPAHDFWEQIAWRCPKNVCKVRRIFTVPNRTWLEQLVATVKIIFATLTTVAVTLVRKTVSKQGWLIPSELGNRMILFIYQ